MKRLNEIFDTPYDTMIKDIKTNSREVNEGDLFVCIMGFNVDRHDYAKQAIEAGAKALVVKRLLDVEVPQILVDDPNKELVNIVTKFYDYPSTKMNMIGVTGTDGKTTTSTIIYQLLNQIDKCGYIGTNGAECPGYKEELNNTTPVPEHLHRIFNNFYEHGCKYVSMETSSNALSQHRCDSIEFDYSIFTNFTHEHLDWHKTVENYLKAKQMLFEQTKKDGYCIINIDDPVSKDIAEASNGKVIYYGENEKADVGFNNIEFNNNGTNFDVLYKDKTYHINSPLLAKFNVYNLTAALTIFLLIGYDINKLDLSKINIDGRMYEIKLGQDYRVIIDFAHTPNATQKILDFANTIKKGKIISVAGSAGDRDVIKRPIIGKILVDNSDYVIFTYDDPRKDDINQIIDEMTKDVMDKKDKFERIIDRKDAIKKAIDIAEKDDIVLILGRGNETKVPIGDEIIYMSDIEEAEKAIKEKETK
ncbi:MAG TPA: UDP-N-acetylmuramoyl-L-alanyl-D-glutamate--2,6-diaminopimelate ligase [Bacilli bacterium]|nr:UDP-N-acetylmuramoyl-L-alanyl-D-glutamate--2,6-diaminopimelate ligase [Bacilli bacterium]